MAKEGFGITHDGRREVVEFDGAVEGSSEELVS